MAVAAQRDRVARAIGQLREAGIAVSLFLDPDPRQLDVAVRLDADSVELHTGRYAAAPRRGAIQELEVLKRRAGRFGRPPWRCTPVTA